MYFPIGIHTLFGRNFILIELETEWIPRSSPRILSGPLPNVPEIKLSVVSPKARHTRAYVNTHSASVFDIRTGKELRL